MKISSLSKEKVENRALSRAPKFPFRSERIMYYHSGRYALWHAMNVLCLPSGSEILVPSYNCGAEIDPLIKQGMKVKVYSVNAKLQIDFSDLRGKIDQNTKALLVIHYFGFPQPMEQLKSICDEKNLFLIEDCAHALLSSYGDRPLGSFGDVSIFSLKKILLLPDGGALVINNEELNEAERPKNPPLREELLNVGKRILSLTAVSPLFFMRGRFSDLLKKVQRKADGSTSFADPYAHFYDYRLKAERIDWGMSKVSRFLMGRIVEEGGIERIIDKRRRNFSFLLHELRDLPGVDTLIDDLPEGVCPFLFPIMVEKRDRVHNMLLEKGIFTFTTWKNFYPDLSWHSFPDAVHLKQHIISFSIHQGKSEDGLLKAIGALKETA
jgi:dTDP-4-amino-4,6-dideoxygalactose transaminase